MTKTHREKYQEEIVKKGIKRMAEKGFKINVEWKLLERIAQFYKFPSAVFLGNMKMFKYKTRNQALRRKAELYDKIKEIIDE